MSDCPGPSLLETRDGEENVQGCIFRVTNWEVCAIRDNTTNEGPDIFTADLRRRQTSPSLPEIELFWLR